MPDGYDVVQVAKGAVIYVCNLCASVTTRPTEHTAYHVGRAARMDEVFADLQAQIDARP